MSVIVRDPEGKIILMSKGADTVIYARLTQDSKNSNDYAKTKQAVDSYAREGLRTLYLGQKEIGE